MQSFFDSMTPWDHNDGSLHVYVLPDDDVADRIEKLQARIDGVTGLPPMPRAWLHFTVNRLAQFDDLSMAELTRLAESLTAELAGVAAFDLEVGAPQVHNVAVECVAEATPGWDALVDAVRRAALATFGGTMPDRPYAPHVSLAYATAEVSDDELRERLDGAPAVGRVRVGKVHLVSVTVRPEVGTFDFVELANWSL
ncbi:2'-5' RNA ligase family protein [Tessaracoccus sp. G1721]